jgi:hypothetical protein
LRPLRCPRDGGLSLAIPAIFMCIPAMVSSSGVISWSGLTIVSVNPCFASSLSRRVRSLQRQIEGLAKGDIFAQNRIINQMFGLAA